MEEKAYFFRGSDAIKKVLISNNILSFLMVYYVVFNNIRYFFNGYKNFKEGSGAGSVTYWPPGSVSVSHPWIGSERNIQWARKVYAAALV